MAVVVITGSNRGFGREAALAFARNGDVVYATMRDPQRAATLLEAAEVESLSVHIAELDVTHSDTFSKVLGGIAEEAGRIDVLVNNAGINIPGSLEDITETDFRRVMETNCTGPLLLARAVLPFMRAERHGTIIMMSSLSGIAGLPGDAAYTASKFALEGATEALRHEVDRWGIRVALIEGGLYATGIFDETLAGESGLPDGYPGDSPYRALIEFRLAEIRHRLSEAFDPKIVADLFVEIAHSDSAQLRWPADAVAKKVLTTMFGQDDTARDEFLRNVAGTRWWTEGKDSPEGEGTA